MPVLSDQVTNSAHIVTRTLAWCCALITKLFVPQNKVSRSGNIPRPCDREILDVPRYCYDASLLFGRMALLRIDRDELARDDPLLLRELQGICTLCGSKGECLRDLARERETGEPQDWQDYCPNVATIKVLGALQNCPRAAQYLKTPHSS